MIETVDIQVKGCEIALPAGAAATSSAHGKLPQIELPGDRRSMIDFVRELALVLKDKGLYRRDTVVVYAYADKRLEMLDVSAFVTWAELHAGFYKKRWDEEAGSFFNVVRSMPGSVSEHAMRSLSFWVEMPEIVRVNKVQKSVRRANGIMELLPVGYDRESKIMTFKL